MSAPSSTARVGVITFPGTLDDVDASRAITLAGGEAVSLWHADADLRGVDAIVVPGGFSYGDYLRAGAIARFAPVMESVVKAAEGGMPVLGICNGFQVLLEAGLLPGAMLRNRSVRFQCEHVFVKVEHADTPFTTGCSPDQPLRIPIAHGDGNYYADPETIEQLETRRQIVFRYATATGSVTPDANPNGSVHNIAGLCNEKRNVVGMMPHPERACELAIGSADGLLLLESAVRSVGQGHVVAAQ